MAVRDPKYLLDCEISSLRTITTGLSETDWARPTGCAAWRVADLIVHLRLGMEEILLGLATTTTAPIDRDATTYWDDWPPRGPARFADVRWLWAQTASYATSDGLRSHFDASAEAAHSASVNAPSGRIGFQSHVMTTEDFLSMWITEFAVHHFDLVSELDEQPAPDEDVVRFLVDTLYVMTGRTRLPHWDDLSFLRKATGRDDLSAEELRELGENAGRYPAFG